MNTIKNSVFLLIFSQKTPYRILNRVYSFWSAIYYSLFIPSYDLCDINKIQNLIDLINKYHSGYDQEGYIE